jgi:HSP20 family protein
MTRHHPDHEVELYKDGNEYHVIVDSDGIEPSDIDVRWHDGRLHVSGERHDDGRNRVFSRHVGVPRDVHEDEITAHYDDGVLEVTLPIADRTHHPGTKIDIDEG